MPSSGDLVLPVLAALRATGGRGLPGPRSARSLRPTPGSARSLRPAPGSARSLRPALAVPALCGPPSQCPFSAALAWQCPFSAARACSPRCPQLRLLPAEASAPGGCLAPRSPLFSPTPALPPDSSPSGRSPRGSAKPRAQAAGPGEADQAGFLRPPCPGARPPVGVRTVASGLGQVQAAPRSQLETDTHVASY